MKVKETEELADMFRKIEKMFDEYPISPLYEGSSVCPVCKEADLKERYKVEKGGEGEEGYWLTPFYYCTNCGNHYVGKKYWKSHVEGIDLGNKKMYSGNYEAKSE